MWREAAHHVECVEVVYALYMHCHECVCVSVCVRACVCVCV